jgi:hypothetical protein
MEYRIICGIEADLAWLLRNIYIAIVVKNLDIYITEALTDGT